MASHSTIWFPSNNKHNEVNAEGNRDGADHNLSWNCGVEGPTADSEVKRLRNHQVKNFLTLTLLATGTPMLLMGDEVRRTQRGNNNAFCQNNEISWFDWTLVESHADLHRFVRELIALRMNRSLPVDAQRLQGPTCLVQPRSVVLLGAALRTQAGQMTANLC
jgi:isoamylase